MTNLRLTAAALALFAILTISARPAAQQKETAQKVQTDLRAPLDPTVKALIEARIETARGVFEAAIQRYETTLSVLPDDTAIWSRRWMEDQLALDPDPAARHTAIRTHLERTSRLEKIMDQYAKAGQGPATDALKMKYFRLEAEQMLAEFRAAHPNLPEPKPVGKR